jgi:peptide-methionine (S)-S-oxide reductase
MNEAKSHGQLATATLGGGCFWCLEAAYTELRGVVKVESGYTGGEVPNPGYRQVCSGTTGRVEVVQSPFDSAVIAFVDLLNVFFTRDRGRASPHILSC